MNMKNSMDIINMIINNYRNTITTITLIKFDNYNLIQERINSKGELEPIFNSAFRIREQYHLPFWDSFNLSLFNQSISDFSFFKEILFHNSTKEIQEIEVEKFILSLNNIDTDDYLTFCSRVKVGENYKHFPLLDFHIPVNINNQKICIALIKQLGLTGYLLDSGKSYHFYGDRLISEEELTFILSKTLLFAPIIDRAWISHQLIQRFCCLRISKKYDRLPIELCYIE